MDELFRNQYLNFTNSTRLSFLHATECTLCEHTLPSPSHSNSSARFQVSRAVPTSRTIFRCIPIARSSSKENSLKTNRPEYVLQNPDDHQVRLMPFRRSCPLAISTL